MGTHMRIKSIRAGKKNNNFGNFIYEKSRLRDRDRVRDRDYDGWFKKIEERGIGLCVIVIKTSVKIIKQVSLGFVGKKKYMAAGHELRAFGES